jgi:hypothetical protein
MLTIFSGFICALMMGFFILRYQDSHHHLTGDHDLSGVKNFILKPYPELGVSLFSWALALVF